MQSATVLVFCLLILPAAGSAAVQNSPALTTSDVGVPTGKTVEDGSSWGLESTEEKVLAKGEDKLVKKLLSWAQKERELEPKQAVKACEAQSALFHTCSAGSEQDLPHASRKWKETQFRKAFTTHNMSSAFERNVQDSQNVTYFDGSCYLPSPRWQCGPHSVLNFVLQMRKQLVSEPCVTWSQSASATKYGVNFFGAGPTKNLRYVSEAFALHGVPAAAVDVPYKFARNVPGCRGTWGCFFDRACSNENPKEKFDRAKDGFQRAQLVAAMYDLQLKHLSPQTSKAVETFLQKPVCSSHTISSSDAVIAMHVRRGDACETFSTDTGSELKRQSERRCFLLPAYIAAAERLAAIYNLNKPTIKLLTDSEQVVQETKKYPQFNWCYLDFNRTSVGGEEGVNLHSVLKKRTFIEHRANSSDGDIDRALIFHTILSDLKFGSDARFVVGTMRSFVTNSLFSLSTVRHGKLPPTISLEGGVIGTFLHHRLTLDEEGDEGRPNPPFPCEAHDNGPANGPFKCELGCCVLDQILEEDEKEEEEDEKRLHGMV
jgi:hypothetical protein